MGSDTEAEREILESEHVDAPVAAALVKGDDADYGEHPWHVGLVREESKKGFLGWFRPWDLRVVMGSSKRARYFYYFFQTDSIDQIHIHPHYSNVSHEYDIAILRLKKIPDLEPGELWPVCLPEQEVVSYAGSRATVIGWGENIRQTELLLCAD